MATKTIKIGGRQKLNTLSVEIMGKTYSVPLAGSMKRKELLALKDGSEEAVSNMFAKHIPEAVLDELTLDEYRQLVDAWSEASDDEQGSSVGES